MIKIYKIIGIIFLILIAALIGYWASNNVPIPLGGAPGGQQTDFSTSSIITLSNATIYTIFATSTPNCTSRIITATSTPIRIKFSDHARWTLSNSKGHFQDASSTVSYDAGIYGCGLWTAVATKSDGNDGTSSVAVTEFGGFR